MMDRIPLLALRAWMEEGFHPSPTRQRGNPGLISWVMDRIPLLALRAWMEEAHAAFGPLVLDDIVVEELPRE